jgi:TP901 family phage tail tape measure protein
MPGRRKIASLFIDMKLGLAQLDKDFKNLQKKFKRAGREVSRAGRDFTVGFGLPAAAALTGATKSFADFDDAMTKSLAIMGKLETGMRDKLERAARDVAKTTTFSAKEAADSYFFLASAGLDAADSVAALPRVAAFAQAGNFDMARATDLLTDAQSALGLTIKNDTVANMENMVRVSDALVKANTLANASVSQFSEALTNKVGARLRNLGKDVEEGLAALAIFADQGLKGAEAGTALEIVLRELEDKALNNQQAFEQLGVKVFDSNGKFLKLSDIIKDLDRVMEGASDKQKALTFAFLGFDKKSSSFIRQLLGTSEALEEMEANLRSAGDITEQVALKQLESFSAKVGILQSKITDLGIEFGNIAANDIQSLAGGVSSLTEMFSNADEGVKSFIVTVLEVSAVAGPVTLALGGIIALLGGPFTAAFAGGVLAVAGLIEVWPKLTAATSQATAAISRELQTIANGFEVLKRIPENLRASEFFGAGRGNENPWAAAARRAQEELNGELAKTSEEQRKVNQLIKAGTDVVSAGADVIKNKAVAAYDELTEGFQNFAKTFREEGLKLAKEQGTVEEFFPDIHAEQQAKLVQEKKKAVVIAAKEEEKIVGDLQGRLHDQQIALIEDEKRKRMEAYEQGVGFYEKLFQNAITGVTFDLEDALKQIAVGFAAEIAQAVFPTSGSFGSPQELGGVLANVLGFGRRQEEDPKIAAKILGEEAGKETGEIAGDIIGKETSRAVSRAVRKEIADQGTTDEGFLTSLGISETDLTTGLAGIGAGVALSNSIKAVDDLINGQNQEQAIGSLIGGVIGSAIGAYFGGAAGFAIGGAVGSSAGAVVGDLFNDDPSHPETLSRIEIVDYLESIFQSADFDSRLRGDFQDFDESGRSPAEQFFDSFGDDSKSANAFLGFGNAIGKLFGNADLPTGQLGQILAEGLDGNIDILKDLAKVSGVTFEQVREQLIQIGKTGEESWLAVISQIRDTAEVFEPGLVAFGDVVGAMDKIIASGGRGQSAISGVVDVMVEAGEAGITSFNQLRDHLVSSGRFTATQIEALFHGFEQAGIRSFEQIGDLSDEELGGIIAAMDAFIQDAGQNWDEMAEAFGGANEVLEKTASTLNGLDGGTTNHTLIIEQRVVGDTIPEESGIETPQSGTVQADVGGDGSVTTPEVSTSAATLRSFNAKDVQPMRMLRQADLKSSNKQVVVNLNAQGAQPGVYEEMLSVMDELGDSIGEQVMRAMEAI